MAALDSYTLRQLNEFAVETGNWSFWGVGM